MKKDFSVLGKGNYGKRQRTNTLNINATGGYVLDQAPRGRAPIVRRPMFDFSRADMNPNIEDPIVYKYRNQ
jgi:hypothetical protein